METYPTVASLRQSREQLRAMLLGGAVEGIAGPDVFPRSAVMRFLLDPARRGIAMMAFGALLRAFRRQ